ncbi:MAG: MMPL family transporter [Acidobacteria bacterium]|nr:MMPL family transporter [Acidobacteriota bacterium]
MSAVRRQPLARRLLGGFAAVSARRPRTVLALAAGAVLASLLGAGFHLGLRTSNLDLIDPDLAPVARFRAFAHEFGTPNVLVVGLEGDDPAALHRAVDELGPDLRRLPGVRSVVDKLPIDRERLAPLGLDPYLSNEDGDLVLVFVQPDDPESSADTIAPFVRSVRQVLEKHPLEEHLLEKHPHAEHGIRATLTGMPAYALDDREIIQRDISRLSALSFALVLLLFVTAFGSFRRPLLAMVALAAGVGLTVGAVTIFPGHLTLLSAFFASILFGLGVDYGIHVIDRVEELVAEGVPEAQAAPAAVAFLAPGLATGALTTASVLLAMTFSGFRGFAELGIVAGIGILICLVAMVTVLPALLALLGPRRRRERPLGERRLGRFLVRLQSRPLAVVIGVAALVGSVAGGPGFDSDYLNLQPKDSEAVRLERRMVEDSDLSPEFAVFTADSAEAARELEDRLLEDDTVSAVRSILDLEALGVEDQLPAGFAAALRSPNGRYAVYAYPVEDVWRPEAQLRFLAHMRAIDPGVTGMPVLGAFMVERSQRALDVTAVLGAVLLALWVWVDFKRPLPALLAALPAVLTVTSMHALMRAFDIPWNPLNVMALPVVLGIAVDDGVHITHRFLDEAGDLARTLAGTGRSVVLTSLTTLAAFGTLALTTHRGLASFALALTLGVLSALLLSVLLLPELLFLARRRLLAEAADETR